MGGIWTPIGFRLLRFLVLIASLEIQGYWSLNADGLALWEFRSGVNQDPYGAFANWDPKDPTPCLWSGVHCLNGKVIMLDLKELYLEGTLAPELAKLRDLKILILHKNRFSGAIPKEFGELTKLELLDLRNNKLSGTIPVEVGGMLSLKRMLLCNNEFEGSIPVELTRPNLQFELQCDENLISSVVAGIGCLNRKCGHRIQHTSFKQLNKAESFVSLVKGVLTRYLNLLPLPVLKLGKDSLDTYGDHCCTYLPGSSETHIVQYMQNLVNVARRRLHEQSSNLPAAPATSGPSPNQIIALPIARSSGTFPAVPNAKKNLPQPAPQPSEADEGFPSPSNDVTISQHSPSPPSQSTGTESSDSSGSAWRYIYIVPGGAALFIFAAATVVMCRTRAAETIRPWKTGLSGQLQKAFITGVPKLNRSELETACEDFSNIIDTGDGCISYKGTLSNGVEIAVASTTITSAKNWSKSSETIYRKKIDTLSRINHKNFVNLIGYCEEAEPFSRMMVFEYAPNGTVYEHLHVEDLEHLDWNARMRIIMGTAYCLQYMHDLNPPVAHTNLHSSCIFLTDDYAAKVAEVSFPSQSVLQSKVSGENSVGKSELPPVADPETNVYNFGILLLELISGKLPYSDEHGPIEKWAAEYLDNKESICQIIDPNLNSVKNDEVDIICNVIKDCIQPNPEHRPTMKDVVARLREVTNISPDQAIPRLSPLWWAELEILSSEAT
ncbi:protein MALE DISCOVERER 2-like [Mangifera indica]|uniref:protein MALE DISCOVERER 2-like n=1 Tax=Mangifera indica TaxID=29780 RepID=UPI001CFBEC0A|nr:protein MALE DISCOVERER 2-like [Mangifera indica]